ncbi:TonB-dependent receptor [Aurantivibrio infirmus]
MFMKKHGLYLGLATCMVAVPYTVSAQDEVLEELVVTGSYIKREKFDSPSPMESFTTEDIKLTGTPSLGQFVRDLTYTQNTDVVANVLSVQDGQQDSNSARFNLRGLGTDSTLTLFDGHRMLDTGNIGAVVPDIATQRIEVVLDGGSAIYGTDAVAGVVNLIPIKEFDGFKVRTYYNQDEDGDLREPKIEFMLGKTFENGIKAVGAIDYAKKSPLLLVDRPEYLAAYDDDFTTGSPGTWRGTSGLAAFGTYLDPDCGQFPGQNTDDSTDNAFPSGYPGASAFGNRCIGEFGQFQDLARESKDFNAYMNISYEINDSIEVEFQANFNRRESILTGSPSVGNTTSNGLLVVPASHPANFQPFAITPRAWSPFQQVGQLPSFLFSGKSKTPYEYETDRYKLASYYAFGDTSWQGETAFSFQRYNRVVDSHQISQSRLQSALYGLGGANCGFDNTVLIGQDPATDQITLGAAVPGAGCEYFNPFGTADVRTTGTFMGNSQALVDWLVVPESYEDTRNYLKYFQSHVTGELFDLPAGPIQMAFGVQVREDIERDYQSQLELIRDDYNEPDEVFNTSDRSEVRGAFVEIDIPVFDSFTTVIAARYEDFVDFDLTTTTPKISFRWEPIENLALRASFGDSFVAPTATQISVQNNQGCSPINFGLDPFLPAFGQGALAGADSCPIGNPDLEPQTSYIRNFGISWRNDAYFTVDLDYQTIDYDDRIITLSRTDVLDEDFAAFQASGLATLADWVASGMMNPRIQRGGAFNQVTEISTYPDNASAIEVNVIDFKMRNGVDTDFGYIGLTFNATSYKKYDYTGFDQSTISAVSNRNADTNLAPPITRLKINTGLSWRGEKNSAGITLNYLDSIKFDGTADTGVPGIGGAPSGNPKAPNAPKKIASHTVIDVRFGTEFDQALGGNWDVSAGIRNLFDSQPDALPVFGGLETRLHTPFGRQFYIDLTYSPDFN